MTKSRPTFSTEFKRDAANFVIEHGYSLVEACSATNVGPTAMRRWVKQLEDELVDHGVIYGPPRIARKISRKCKKVASIQRSGQPPIKKLTKFNSDVSACIADHCDLIVI